MNLGAAIAGQIRVRQDAAIVAFLAEEPGPVPEMPVRTWVNRAPLADYDQVVNFLSDPAAATPHGEKKQTGGGSSSSSSRLVQYDAEHGNDGDYGSQSDDGQADATNEILEASAASHSKGTCLGLALSQTSYLSAITTDISREVGARYFHVGYPRVRGQ